MKKLAAVFCLLMLVTLSARADLDVDTLTRTLNLPKVKDALKDQSIISIKVVDDQDGRADFDYSILVCAAGNDDSTQKPFFTKTHIDGKYVFFRGTRGGDVTQTKSGALDPSCL